MDLLNRYLQLQQQIHDYFGYQENWAALPIEDSRDKYWYLLGEGPGEVHFADSEEELITETGNCYVNLIYTNRHLPRWVYRGKDYTMVCVDTQCDLNRFLQIFDNSREREPPEYRED